MIAAEKTRRKARLIELDPIYCDVIVRRWQALTGELAKHAETGEAFDDRAASQVGEDDAPAMDEDPLA